MDFISQETIGAIIAAVSVAAVALFKFFMQYIFLKWLGGKLVDKFDKLIKKWICSNPRYVAIWEHYTHRHPHVNPLICKDGKCTDLNPMHGAV